MNLTNVLVALSDLVTNETTSADVITVLSMFLDQKNEEMWSTNVTSVYLLLKSMIGINDIDEHTCQLEYFDVVYSWLKHGDISNVYKDTQTNIKPGEFVRNMLKLNNICKEALKACYHLNKSRITQLLEPHQHLIVRGIVIPNSLYVNSKFRST
jgi:superfamily II RNA helicase